MSIVDVRPPRQARRVAVHPVGTRITVRNRYMGTWCDGFEVVALEADGYRIKRDSDGATIAQLVAFEDVREALDVREPFEQPEGDAGPERAEAAGQAG